MISPSLPALSLSPLRIALFTYSTKLRGSVVHTLELAEALYELGHGVCVYALSKDGSGFERSLSCEVCLIPAAPAPSDTDRLIYQRIQEFVRFLQDRPLDHDIFHAQDCLSANALVELRRQHVIPNVLRTVHHIEEYRSPYLRHCQDTSIREADQCLCVSDRWHRELRQHYGIEAGRVVNGVNPHLFSTQATALDQTVRHRWALNTAPLYLTVGGLEPRKNSLNLLRAFAQVRDANPQAKLVVVGGETLFDYQDYRHACFALMDELNLRASVVLAGVVSTDELAALYRVADAFLFPSLKEGWGLVVLEAIASGLPVVTSNQAPFTEFLSPAQALLVDPENPAAIAQAMHRITDPALARSLVQASTPILSSYTWNTSAQQHLQHYRQVLSRASPPCPFRSTRQSLSFTPSSSMPEIQFKIQWPDGSPDLCYSPSLVVKEYFSPNQDYELKDFVARSRTALTIASDRVKAKYGMPCSMALRQLSHIENMASQYHHLPQAQVRVVEFLE